MEPSLGGGWHRRQRRRVAPYRVGGGGGGLSRRSLAIADINSGGCGHLMEQWSSKSIDSDSTCSSSSQLEECSESSEQKVEQILREVVDNRQSPPGVIAKIMGLDELPHRQITRKRQMTASGFLQKPYFTELEEKQASASDHLYPTCTNEHQGLRYGDEETESKIGVENNTGFSKALPMFASSQPIIICSSRKSTDEKDFSSDESLKSATESSEELADQYRNNDNFLNAYKGVNSLFRNNLRDLKWLVPSHQARVTTISSSKHERSELVCGSQRKHARSDHTKASNLVTPFLKSAKLQKVENNHFHVHQHPIFILKPSSESHLSGEKKLPSQNTQMVQPGKRRQMTESKFPETYAKRINRWSLLDKIDAIGVKRKGSRKIAREVTNYMRYYMISDTKGIPFSGDDRYLKHGESSLYGANNMQNTSSLLASPIKRIAGKRARHRFNERSKIANRPAEAECSATNLKTLGEMFALSDKETSNVAPKPPKFSQIPDRKSGRCEMLTRSSSSPRFTNRDGWNDWYLIKLPKSTYPCLPINSGQKCLSSRRGAEDDYFCSTKRVNDLAPQGILQRKLSERGGFSKKSFTGLSNMQPFRTEEDEYNIHPGNMPIDAEKLRNKGYEKAPESNCQTCSDYAKSDVVKLVKKFCTSMQNNRHPVMNKELTKHEVKKIEISCNDQKVIDCIQELSSVCNKVDYLPDHLETKDLEPESPSSSKDTVQPSPVSVLEFPLKQGRLHIPNEFPEGITGSHVQLHLLELDSENKCLNGLKDVRAHGDITNGITWHAEQKAQIIEEFMDEEERDFSYLLDILIDSGLHSANQYKLYKEGFLQEYPLGKGTLEKLEKKYRKLILCSGSEKHLVFWSRSERRLFFDFINCILADILAPCTEPNPWANHHLKVGAMWGSEGLVEKTWQLLVRKREELSRGNPDKKVLDGKWLELVQYVDEVGREIEGMLYNDLLEELVSEFISG